MMKNDAQNRPSKPPRPGKSAPDGDARPKRGFRPDAASPSNAAPRREAGLTGLSEAGERIARVMARAGLCSRREAETWILAGRVAVNGRVIDSPALDIKPKDHVEVDGKPLPERERTRLWLYHKQRGLVTTAADPEGRPTVFDHLPPGLGRVVSVGRLDINTEGLMLLTNDGGLARVLAHPDTAWLRRYRVRVHGEVNQAALDTLRHGITLDGVEYGPIIAVLEREIGENAWIVMDLREGKNREIKRVLEHLGLQVARLIRVSFGPFHLDDLGEGAVEEVRTKILKDQLGARLIEAAEAYFDGPRRDSVAEKAAMLQAPPRPRRFDKRKPIEKRDLALAGEAPDLSVRREKIADRKGRTIRVERVIREIPREAPAPEARSERPYGRSPGRSGFQASETGKPRRGRDFRGREFKSQEDAGRERFGRKPPRQENRQENRQVNGPEKGRENGQENQQQYRAQSRQERAQSRQDGRPARGRDQDDRAFKARGNETRPYAPRADEGGRRARSGDKFAGKAFGDRPARDLAPRDHGRGAKGASAPRGERPGAVGAQDERVRPSRARPDDRGAFSAHPARSKPSRGDTNARKDQPRGPSREESFAGKAFSGSRNSPTPENAAAPGKRPGKSFGGRPNSGKPGGGRPPRPR